MWVMKYRIVPDGYEYEYTYSYLTVEDAWGKSVELMFLHPVVNFWPEK